MRADLKNYAIYADYGRRTLLRLNIVYGLSDEIKVAIVIQVIVIYERGRYCASVDIVFRAFYIKK